eukprot:scaffold8732_cov87-Cylindrotheca_fusiformis.AAC.6
MTVLRNCYVDNKRTRGSNRVYTQKGVLLPCDAYVVVGDNFQHNNGYIPDEVLPRERNKTQDHGDKHELRLLHHL